MQAISLRLLLLFVFLNEVTGEAISQAIVITEPLRNKTISEGDDFARAVLKNPWDFKQRRDLGWEEGFSEPSISVVAGRWFATSSAANAYVFPLFGGFPGTVLAEGPEGDYSLPRYGFKHPIDTSRYYMMSFQMASAARSSVAVYWAHYGATSPFPDGSNYVAFFDGSYHRQYSLPNENNKDFVYYFDLRNMAGFPLGKGSWTGKVVSLRIDPSLSAGSGTTTSFDWIRLVDPASTESIQISWQSSGLTSDYIIRLFVDADATGYDGVPLYVFTNGQNPGTISVPGAIFPPGRYFYYLSAERVGRDPQRLFSNYSASLTVSEAPQVSFLAPTELTGKDFSSEELNNSWNMASAGDVANLSPVLPQSLRQFSNYSFVNGVFQALSDPPLSGARETDAQVWLNIPASKPIRSSVYRYLTYRLNLDGTGYGNMHDRVKNGFVARTIYWGQDLFLEGGSSKEHPIFEGQNVYTWDLSEQKNVEAGLAWADLPLVRNMRIDPLETSRPVWFHLDWVKLTQENRTADGEYEVRWNIEDSDSSSFTVEIFYDSDNKGFNGRRIKTLTDVKKGRSSYRWRPGGLAVGASFYLYLKVSDGRNTALHYSPVPVIISGPITRSARRFAERDYDGDGLSDEVVYRGSAGGFFVKQSSLGPKHYPMPPGQYMTLFFDYDGDGRSDPATVGVVNGYLLWTIKESSSGVVISRYWGLAGDIPIAGDFRGQGRGAIGVYRPSSGMWYVLFEDNTLLQRQWGLPGDVPLARDLDNDGKDELVVWRPATGVWWVLYDAQLGSSARYRSWQWGLPGDIPLLEHALSGEGSAFYVFRPASGTWYRRSVDNEKFEIRQWGLPGDIPRLSDVNGDGFTDLSVWRSGGGYWYHFLRGPGTAGANVRVVQWGLPGDMVP